VKPISLRAFLLFFGLLLGARAVRAGGRPVELVLAGPAARLDAVETTLSEPLGRLPIELRSSRLEALDVRSVVEPNSRGDALHVWVDLGAETQATLYFTDASWERILIRRFPLAKGLDEVEREELAQIVRSAVEALLGGAKIGISREDAKAELLPEEPPPPPPAPTPVAPVPKPPVPKQDTWRLLPGALYEATPYAGALWQGPGFSLDLDANGFGARAMLGYRAPILLEGDQLGVRLQGLTLRALAGFAPRVGRLRLRAGAGGGLDVTHVEPRRVGPGGQPSDSFWDLVPVARAEVGAGWPLGGVELGLHGGIEGDWVATRHVAERGGRERTVVEASRLRPFFGLGVRAE